MTVEEAQSVAWAEAVAVVVDPRWKQTNAPIPGMVRWFNRAEQLEVLLSAAVMDDGRRWVHFSIVGRTALPSWDQLVRAKEAILGRYSKAIQVLAPRSEWINIHERCLHLFVCLDEDPLPDFTMGSGSL